MYLSLSLSLDLSLYIYIYIYIYRERERHSAAPSPPGTDCRHAISREGSPIPEISLGRAQGGARGEEEERDEVRVVPPRDAHLQGVAWTGGERDVVQSIL